MGAEDPVGIPSRTSISGGGCFAFGFRELRRARQLHERRSDHSVADAVAASQLRGHGVLGLVGRLLVTDRLVELGIEGHSDGADLLQAVRAERLLKPVSYTHLRAHE